MTGDCVDPAAIACYECDYCVCSLLCQLVIMLVLYTRSSLGVDTAAVVSYEFNYSLCSTFCQPCNSSACFNRGL